MTYDSTAYNQGYAAGAAGEDSRSCPYEGHDGVHWWLEGYADGRKSACEERP